MMDEHLYHYRAYVVSVYDGDTITVDFDLGLRSWLKGQKIRFLGIDTPEIRGGTDETKLLGREARDFVKDKILGKNVLIKTEKDKHAGFSRWGGYIYFQQLNESTGQDEWICLNDLLVEEGHAVAKDY